MIKIILCFVLRMVKLSIQHHKWHQIKILDKEIIVVVFKAPKVECIEVGGKANNNSLIHTQKMNKVNSNK